MNNQGSGQQAPSQIDFSHRIPNQLAYTAFGQEQAIQIDRLHGIRSLCLSAVGSMSWVANTAVALTEPGMITDIRLTVGGGTVLWAGDYQALYRINQLEYGVAPPFVNGIVGTTATASYTTSAILDLQSVMGRAPVDTVLISRLFSSIELRAKLAADITAAASGLTAANGTFVSFAIDVTLNEVVNLKEGFGKFVKKVSFIEREVTSTQTEFVMPLPTGNLMKDIYIRTFQTGLPVDTIINNVKVMVGGEVVYDEKSANIKLEQLLRNQMNAAAVGYYHISLAPDRILSEGINLSKVAALGCNLVVDVTKVAGTCLMRAHTKELLPIL